MVRITNRQARRLLIQAHGLSLTPTGPLNLAALIKTLGYVQLDTIRTVSRAHHHILWSRNQNYREHMLWDALKNRELFEHFTHDASLLPIEFYPIWNWQFKRMQKKFERRKWRPDPELLKNITSRIIAEGPLSTHAFDTKVFDKSEMWARPPHKRALDYLWYTGKLTTSHRENFTKFYDLPERIIPLNYLSQTNIDAPLAWLCEQALERLTLATPAEIQDFWGAASALDVKNWLGQASCSAKPVEVERADGRWVSSFAAQNIETKLADLKAPTSRLRILNPFDPLVRDRKRLKRIFEFDYKIEIFVPAAKRQWGYYVYPILEGDRFIGRIEVKADRIAGRLNILNLWKEPHINWSTRQDEKLKRELGRLAKLATVKSVDAP